jgi:predicted acylesterase/phospholipase RssA/ABC-type metal ion transport system substrate-binding protein
MSEPLLSSSTANKPPTEKPNEATAEWLKFVNNKSLGGRFHSIKTIVGQSDNFTMTQEKVIGKFDNFMRTLIDESSLFLPGTSEQIMEEGKKISATITEALGGARNFNTLKAAIIKANYDAKHTLLTKRETLVDERIKEANKSTANISPLVVQHKNVTNPLTGISTTILKVLVKARHLTQLTISGGGGKGAVIPDILKELENNGLLSNVKKLTGSSVGALSATLFSVTKAADCQNFLAKHPISEFKNDVPGFKQRYPNVKFVNASIKHKIIGPLITGHRAGNSAERAFELLDIATSTKVQDYLRNNWKKIFPTNLKEESISLGISPHDEARLTQLRDQIIVSKKDRSADLLTFSDLQLLHEIDPSTFKELEITGFNMATQKLEVFNAENTPDMPVALAARISMALPPVFKLVKANPTDHGALQTYADGGFGANTYLDVINLENQDKFNALFDTKNQQKLADFENQVELDELSDTTNQQQSAALVFNDDGYGHDAHGIRETTNVLPSEMKAQMKKYANFVGLHPHTNLENAESDIKRIYALGLNSFIMNHAEMGTLNLNPDEKMLELAKLDARVAIKEQILARMNQATLVSVTSIQALYERLTDEEKSAIVLGGEPIKPSFRQQGRWETKDSYARSKALSEENVTDVHDLNCELYDLCISAVNTRKAKNGPHEEKPRTLSERPSSSSDFSMSNGEAVLNPKTSEPVNEATSNPPPAAEEKLNPLQVNQDRVEKQTPLQYLSDLKIKLSHLLGVSYQYLTHAKLDGHKHEKIFIQNVENYVKAIGVKPSDDAYQGLLQLAKEIQAHELLLLEKNLIKRENLLIAGSTTASN